MNFHIRPKQKKWVATKSGSKLVETFSRRRDAIERVKGLAAKDDVIFVHNASGMVTIRIPEI